MLIKKIYILLTALLFSIYTYSQENECTVVNQAFEAGEQISYIVSYNWLLVWTEVGGVTFTTENAKLSGVPCLKITAKGKTFKTWDWFFKVRDEYQSWVDPLTVHPYYYKRDVDEGGFKIDISYVFNHESNKVFSASSSTKHPEIKRDTVDITPCTFDLISITYYLRNLNMDNILPEDTIRLKIMLDRELTDITLVYRGRGTIKVKDMGRFNADRFSIALVAGTVFKENDWMDIWVTADKNRIPVYIKSPILIGAVKVRVVNMKGLKYPLTSLIEE